MLLLKRNFMFKLDKLKNFLKLYDNSSSLEEIYSLKRQLTLEKLLLSSERNVTRKLKEKLYICYWIIGVLSVVESMIILVSC